jgi:biopolymer transport protein ExbD
MMKPIAKPPSLPAPKVEIINLIDVLITLIAFFMFTTVFANKQGQIRLDLPSASQSQSVKGTLGMEISLTKANKIFVGDKQLGLDELGEYLKTNCRTDDLITIKADRECKYEWVISLLEKVKNSGISKVGLRVRPKE